MNKVNVFPVDQFYPGVVLVNETYPAKLQCVELSLPFSLDFEVKTPELFAGEPSFIALKSSTGKGFSPNLACLSEGSVIKPVLVAPDLLVIPVQKSSGVHSFALSNGETSVSFDVLFKDTLDSQETFVFTRAYHLPFYSNLTRKVVVEVENSFTVNRITVNGIPVTKIMFLDSNFLMFSCFFLSQGTYDINLYDSDDVLLHSFSVSVLFDQDIDVGVAGKLFGDLMYVYPLSLLPEGVFLNAPSEALIKPISSFVSLSDRLEFSMSDRFVYIVRDRAGNVVPLTGFTVSAPGFSFSGFSDRNGVISLSWDSLPQVFDLAFSSYDLNCFNQTVSNKGK